MAEADSLALWSTPQCPVTVAYSPRVLDDIRLAVVDAFFSLPRGGAEIGGILLGSHESGRVEISGYTALDCEHAFGPSFTLSPKDLTALEALLAAARANAGDSQPVGWYHSHTRSEIFLSEADQDIHKRFFPEPWQVALVMKPHTFQPARGGFFFIETDGSIHASASYLEFTLDPLPLQAVPMGGARVIPTEPAAEAEAPPVHEPDPEPAPPAAPAAPPAPPDVNEPAPAVKDGAPEAPAEMLFQQFSGRRKEKPRAWLKAVAALAVVAVVVWGFRTHPQWVSRALAAIRPAPAAAVTPARPVSLGLNTIDTDGQLQIRWDRTSPAVLKAAKATLHVDDGSPVVRDIRLDPAHLQSGVFTLKRDTEKIDVALTVEQPNGPAIRQATAFAGKLPDAKPAEDASAVKERDDLAVQVVKLKAEVKSATDRNLKLLRTVDELRARLREQQRSRLANQSDRKR